METQWKSTPHRFPRSPHSSQPTRKSWWARSLRPPPIRSRSCCYQVSSTGCANGGTPAPTRSTGGSSAENPPNTAKTTNNLTFGAEPETLASQGWSAVDVRGEPAPASNLRDRTTVIVKVEPRRRVQPLYLQEPRPPALHL